MQIIGISLHLSRIKNQRFMKNEIEMPVNGLWPHLSRVIEIAMLGGFTVNICYSAAYSDVYPMDIAKEDYELIKQFYKPVFYGLKRAGVANVAICKPDMRLLTSKSITCEPLSRIVDRVDKARLNPDPAGGLDTAGRALLKTATDKLCLSVKQTTDVQDMSRAIAKLEGCATVLAQHVAEAVHYVRATVDGATPLESEEPASVWAALPAQGFDHSAYYSASIEETERFISDMRVLGVDYYLIELKPINQ